ncbi:hypothetical protein [Amycolatopsis thermoflava]|uniref:hypothetical protein n=1 Tax=Amycolatopsis thermoflava TaxID=84480 RepID=UPI0012F95387|nr:hypothetical protein [Amycolatopsis thermoflava]
MAATDDHDQGRCDTDADAPHNPRWLFTWSIKGVDAEGRPVHYCAGATADGQVCVQVGSEAAYFTPDEGIDASTGLRLAIDRLRPPERWWS